MAKTFDMGHFNYLNKKKIRGMLKTHTSGTIILMRALNFSVVGGETTDDG